MIKYWNSQSNSDMVLRVMTNDAEFYNSCADGETGRIIAGF